MEELASTAGGKKDNKNKTALGFVIFISKPRRKRVLLESSCIFSLVLLEVEQRKERKAK